MNHVRLSGTVDHWNLKLILALLLVLLSKIVIIDMDPQILEASFCLTGYFGSTGVFLIEYLSDYFNF